jgi:hypothetical protein
MLKKINAQDTFICLLFNTISKSIHSCRKMKKPLGRLLTTASFGQKTAGDEGVPEMVNADATNKNFF